MRARLGLLALVIALVVSTGWCVATLDKPNRFIFLPGGDVGLGFRSYAGQLEWIEYAAWDLEHMDTQRWSLPWWAVIGTEASLLALLVRPAVSGGASSMGSSFTRFRDHGFWSRDATIEVWLYLLARQVEALDDPPDWLVAAREDWQLNATLGVTGCVTAALDQHLSSPDRVALVLSLAEQALARLRAHGPVMSAALLNSFGTGGEGAYFTGDLPTELFIRVGEAFIQLLRGKITWDALTSPMVEFPPK